MRKKTTSEIICENFKIPSETIFQDYKCTFKSSVTFFGRLYVGEEHFLFIANMFGLVKKCTININHIVKIEESLSSSVITIVETSEGADNQYVFGSFKNSNAYQLMKALWKGEKIGSDVLKVQLEQENQQFNKSQKVDPKLLLDEGQVEANFFNTETVESLKQKIVEIVLPCTVQQFYDFFLSDKATVYPRKKHLELRNSRDINVTEWKKNQELKSEVRQITTLIKVNGVPFVKEAGMSQVWNLKRQQQQLDLRIVTQMSDVPYSAYFNCEEHTIIEKQTDKKCRMTVWVSVFFNKSTYLKGTILSRTLGDMKQQYEFWIMNTSKILDQMRKKKQLESRSSIVMEYEENLPFSDKSIPEPAPSSQSQQSVRKFYHLTLEQKVDFTFKLILLLVFINVIQIIF